MNAERQPRTIRTIVVAYSLDELPPSVVQIHRRFEHAVAKAGWAIRVRLEPLEDLPERYDIVVVDKALRERAEQLEGDAILIVTTRETVARACDQLLGEIARGDLYAAERADPNAPKIVTRRGMEIL